MTATLHPDYSGSMTQLVSGQSISAVAAILAGKMTISDAVSALMSRPLKSESD